MMNGGRSAHSTPQAEATRLKGDGRHKLAAAQRAVPAQAPAPIKIFMVVQSAPTLRLAWALQLVTALILLSAMILPGAAVAQSEVPPLTGRVMDAAGILSPETEAMLTDLLRTHEDSTGNQIVVATVPSLSGEAIEEFTLRAGREWGIGTDENDNGILLIVAPSERKVRIEVGYGLEGAVPDAVAARIIRREIIPQFRDGDFDGGVAAGTIALLEAVRGEYRADDGPSGPMPVAVRIVLGLVFALLVALAGFGVLMIRSETARYIVMTLLLPLPFAVGAVAAMSAPIGLLSAAAFAVAFIYLSGRSSVESLRERMAEAAKKDRPTPVAVGPFTIHVGGSSSGGGRSSGGGFSGGGGSFGGGGATGGW